MKCHRNHAASRIAENIKPAKIMLFEDNVWVGTEFFVVSVDHATMF